MCYNHLMTPLVLHNTLTRRKEAFIPEDGHPVRMYCCGPTVYNYAHIGNLRTYIFEDLLHRALQMHGWDVQHVMNITDVGHMTSDADAGEDKMAKAAEREQKSPWEIARFYEDAFFQDSARLNIIRPDIAPRATEHVAQMISLIQRLEAEGYTYETPEGIYFDTAKNADYGKLAGLNLGAQLAGAREDVNIDVGKKHPADFILWFTNKPTHIMKWPSPWGRRLSRMAYRMLGDEHGVSGRDTGYPLRRHRPYPGPQHQRDRAERMRDRSYLCPILGAWGVSERGFSLGGGGRRQNVQIRRELPHRAAPDRPWLRPIGISLPVA